MGQGTFQIKEIFKFQIQISSSEDHLNFYSLISSVIAWNNKHKEVTITLLPLLQICPTPHRRISENQ